MLLAFRFCAVRVFVQLLFPLVSPPRLGPCLPPSRQHQKAASAHGTIALESVLILPFLARHPSRLYARPFRPNWEVCGRIQGLFCRQRGPSHTPSSSSSALWAFEINHAGLQGLPAAGENSYVRSVTVSWIRMLTSPKSNGSLPRSWSQSEPRISRPNLLCSGILLHWQYWRST